MIRGLLTAMLLLGLGWSAAACADELRMAVTGEVGIDPQGNVFAVDIQTVVTPAVHDLLEKTVRQWKFEPVVQDGKAVYAKSLMHLDLLAKKVDSGYQLQVDGVRFCASRRALAMQPSSYPREAARARVMADVLVAVRVDAGGQVVDAVATQVAFPQRGIGPSQAASWSKTFAKAAVEAARNWRYAPADVAAGDLADATLIVPVTYRVDAASASTEGWRNLPNVISTPIPWLPAAAQSFDATGLRQGEALALQSNIALKTPVVGQAL
ncbi:MAG: hypothetical protein QM601_13160 [Pseudoxanthomonas sp.]